MQADLSVILPEIILAIFSMAALLGAVYTVKDKLAPMLVWVTAALMVVLGIWIGTSGSGATEAFGGMIVNVMSQNVLEHILDGSIGQPIT